MDKQTEEQLTELVGKLTEAFVKQRETNDVLEEALELIAHGCMSDMRIWLVRNEPSQPNNHSPLTDCSRAMLCELIAEQALTKGKGE